MTQPRTTARWWIFPALIVGLLASQIAVGVATVILAVGDPAAAIEPDYYARAQRWAASAQLGWGASVRVDSAAGNRGQRAVTLQLHDADRAAINDAVVQVEFFHHARGGERQVANLAAVGPGVYSATLPLARPGIWELRFTANRAGQTFHHVQQVDIAGPAGGRS